MHGGKGCSFIIGLPLYWILLPIKLLTFFYTIYLLHSQSYMQGVDPDAPEEDEENDVDDADGDQEETELL